jgi:hypothetical protein
MRAFCTGADGSVDEVITDADGSGIPCGSGLTCYGTDVCVTLNLCGGPRGLPV